MAAAETLTPPETPELALEPAPLLFFFSFFFKKKTDKIFFFNFFGDKNKREKEEKIEGFFSFWAARAAPHRICKRRGDYIVEKVGGVDNCLTLIFFLIDEILAVDSFPFVGSHSDLVF